MAATKLILLAACPLPGLHTLAQAETLPEYGTISTRLIHFSQTQVNADGDNRLSVSSPAVHFTKPLDGKWLVEGTLLHDSVSGASPRYHTSAASRMSDERVAGDLALTRYFERSTVGAGVAYSDEHDYRSTAVSLRASISSEDNNTTWNAGIGFSDDQMNPTNGVVKNEKRQTLDATLGMTQVLTPVDIVQLSLTHSTGDGYYSDPYKPFDKRPRQRDATAVQVRWNHHIKEADASARMSYRYYSDSFQVKAHTVALEVVKPLGNGWTLTPGVRYYTQSKASFYADAPFPGNASSATYYSADQRLGTFGAVTLGMTVAKQISQTLQVDLKVESYRQRSAWALSGTSAMPLAPLNAFNVQAGLSYRW